jgi:hypothetical protein
MPSATGNVPVNIRGMLDAAGEGVRRNRERFSREFVALSSGICRFWTDLKPRYYRPATTIRGDPGLSVRRWGCITACSRIQRVTSANTANKNKLTPDRSVGIMPVIEKGEAR